MPVAAIFDLDGTLVTFNLDIREWRKVLIDLMKKSGFDTGGLDLTTPTQQILDDAEKQSESSGGSRFTDLRREAFSILDSLELDGAASASIFPDALETLGRLKSKGVRLCVLTNSGRAAAKETLAKHHLDSFFEFVLTRDDTEKMKPWPEGLVKAVGLLGARPADTYYVGDSAYDIMAAKRAGIRAVSVTTGNYTAERLRSEGADYIIGGLAELPAIFGL